MKLPVTRSSWNTFMGCTRAIGIIHWVAFLTTFAEKLQISSFNLQRYQSGQHYQNLHTERSSLATLHRVFAWMTYLNDVDQEDGGSTLFSHYDLAIQPRKGLTLIWPAEWTHAHKGNVLRANNKYIITGWMTFQTRSTTMRRALTLITNPKSPLCSVQTNKEFGDYHLKFCWRPGEPIRSLGWFIDSWNVWAQRETNPDPARLKRLLSLFAERILRTP